MSELKFLFKKAANLEKTLEWIREIKWKLVFAQLLLHIALAYGFYLMFTSQVKLWTLLWGDELFSEMTDHAM